MRKSKLFGVLIGLGMLVLANALASAQAGNDGVIKIDGGRTAIVMPAPSQPFTPTVLASSKLVTIYSTLGKGKNVYSTLSGFGILGTDTGQMLPQMVANGFRAKVLRPPRDRDPGGGGRISKGRMCWWSA